MKKIKRTLAAILSIALAGAMFVPVMAEEAGEVYSNEAVIFEDDYTGSVPLWFNYNTNNNDKRVLTINQKQFDWAAQDYTGWFYENVAHITTLNIAPFENRMEKRYFAAGSAETNMYTLPNRLGDDFRIETRYYIEHVLQRATPADGEYSARTVVTNDEYLLEYTFERDGIWVLSADGVWVRKVDLDTSYSTWYAEAEVHGDEAVLTFTRGEDVYTFTYTIPDLATANEVKREFFYGTKVTDQTKDGEGNITWENHSSYNIEYTKASNLYEDYVYVDDMQSAKAFGEYSNMSVQPLSTVACGQTQRLLLTDKTTQGVVTYTIPQNNRITDFTVVKIQDAGHQSTIQFQLIKADGTLQNIPNQPAERTDAAVYENRDYLGGGFVYYYETNSLLRELLKNGEYTGLKVWVWVDQGVTDNGEMPSLAYADICFAPDEAALDQLDQPEIPEYSGDVIIDDDFSGDTIDWFAFRQGIINVYNDAIQKNDGNILFAGLGTPTVSPHISTYNGNYDQYALSANILDNYAFEMSYTTHTFFEAGDPSTTGNLSDYAKVNNGKYLLWFTSEKDGVWAYTSEEKWENIIPAALKYGMDCNVKAIVNGNTADIYLSYETKYGKSRVYKASYTMPADETWDRVTVGMDYNTYAENNNAIYYLDDVKLTNITEHEVMAYRGAASGQSVTLGENTEVTAVDNLYRGVTSQYDLIDPAESGSIVFEPGGYIRDFAFTRRLGGQYQGDMTVRMIDENGTVVYLAKGTEFKEEIGGFYNDGHLYFCVPADSYKEVLAAGNFTKIEVVLLPNAGSNYPANEIYPGLVSSYIAYDAFDDITIGEHMWQVNSIKGVAAFAVDFTKHSSGTLRLMPVLALYDENDVLKEVYISEIQEFEQNDNRAISIGPVSSKGKLKAFLWDADTMKPLCEPFER